MSNEHGNDMSDKQQVKDEAFISGLYAQLNDDVTPEALDQKILAAAHREVGAKPVLIKKHPKWLVPLSSAASLMLVIALGWQQIDGPGSTLAQITEDMDTPEIVAIDRGRSAKKSVHQKLQVTQRSNTVSHEGNTSITFTSPVSTSDAEGKGYGLADVEQVTIVDERTESTQLQKNLAGEKQILATTSGPITKAVDNGTGQFNGNHSTSKNESTADKIAHITAPESPLETEHTITLNIESFHERLASGKDQTLRLTRVTEHFFEVTALSSDGVIEHYRLSNDHFTVRVNSHPVDSLTGSEINTSEKASPLKWSDISAR